MMESPLERRDVVVPKSGNEESETGGVDHSYTLEEGLGLGTSTFTDTESGTESDELDEEAELLTPTSKKEETTTVGGHDSKRNLKEEESNSDTDKSSDGDTETQADQNQDDEGNCSEVSSTENDDQGTHAEKEEGERVWKPNLQEEQNKAPPDEGSSAALGDMAPESVEMEGQILGNKIETPISISQEISQRDDEVSSLERCKVPTPEESEPSSSQVRVMMDVGPDLLDFDRHGIEDLIKAEDEYVKKGYSCDANTEEEDEELREYWTRALQTSTSTGEIVEEIVKVLKHRQKTHDLLCPVCGSCVTRRVILRKRKRSSFISVDRWYQDEGEVQEGALPEVPEPEAEEPDTLEYQDVEAFGCLSCFSLFFQKGRQILTQLQDMGPDTYNCLPFFFPPYPWGMTQMKSRSSEEKVEEREPEELHESEESAETETRPSFTCGIGSTLLPEYPWGTMPSLLKEFQEEVSGLGVAEDTPLLDVQDASSMDIRPDFTCGIGSTLLPDYPWGTAHILSKGKPSDQTQGAGEAGSSTQDVMQREDIVKSSDGLNEDRTCSCGLAPSILPAYPWGVCRKHTRVLEDAGTISQSVEDPQRSVNESTCTCGIAEALFPTSYITKVEEVASKPPLVVEGPPEDASPSVPEDANLQSVSEPEISEEAPQLVDRQERSCTCGLLPALLPDYAWGLTRKDKGVDTVENKTDMQAKPVQETERKEAEDTKFSCDISSALLPDYPWGMTSESQDTSEDVENQRRGIGWRTLQNGAHMDIGSAVLPSYPWGKCSVHGQNGRVQPHRDAEDRDCTCGLGFTMLPAYPWGHTVPTAGNVREPIVSSQEVKNYIEQETKIEARITSKTDVYTLTSTKMTYPGEKPPQIIKTVPPHETTQTVQHVKLDQTVTVINASVKFDEAAGTKGPSLVSLPSTGFSLLDLGLEGGLGGKERLESRPSTGYARLEELIEEQELPISEIEEDPASVKYKHPKPTSESTWQWAPQENYYKHEKAKPPTSPSGMQFPSFEWSVAKVDAGDLATPLLQASIAPESETFISVLKPSPTVRADEPKSDNWLSIFKVSKPSDEGGLTAPLLSPTLAYTEEIEEVKGPVPRPQIQVMQEAVIDVPPSDLGGTSVGTTSAIAPALGAEKKKEGDDWDILKSIVFGGLEISIASLGVTSSAAGGNAITRTVVYMGLATLFSGLIGFYHNVLNLYHYHKDHYIDVVGLTLMLHGTVALISYFVFGALSPLVYALSYRETDDRDDKFILCCGVTVVAVTALALGKAKVSNKRYLRTLCAYLVGGVIAAIIGYLTGEHVAELLEEWGI